jgi:hypothetical protein
MTTTGNNGRLGNQIIRNIAVSIIALKHNLKVTYFNKKLINKLGIKLFSGNNIYNITHELNDSNYFSIYNCDNLNYNLNSNKAYFQTKEIIIGIYNYLHILKNDIIQNNKFKNRYNNNNDLYIHIRLGDVANKNPGISYYLNTIKNITFDNLYISTDDKKNIIVNTIIKSYSNATLIDYNEIKTIQFATTCKHIILSHGSFSALIGYLSFFSTIYYPAYELDNMWHGDMFSIKGWIKCDKN